MYLRENPWHNRQRTGKEEWERRAVEQGMVAVKQRPARLDQGPGHGDRVGSSSITCSYPCMLTDNGQTVAERIGKDTLLIKDTAGSEGQPR